MLDFQDAVYGPITYDIASLLRDAFISWDEDFVIDITVRYWEKARKAGLLGAEPEAGARLWRVLPQCRMDGPAAPPEGGRHLCPPDAARRQTKYLQDAPRFLRYIRATADRYRELGRWCKLIDQIEGTQEAVGYSPLAASEI